MERLMVLKGNKWSDIEEYKLFFTGFAFVGCGFDRAQRNHFCELPGQGFLFGNNQISPAGSAADPKNGSFNDDFVQVKQSHITSKCGLE